MFLFEKSPASERAWLEKLARRLTWSFPEPQAKEILTDLQAQFEAGREHGKSDAEIIDALGTPREAVAQLLEEEPAARIEQFRHTLLWAAAAVVCWAFMWLCLMFCSCCCVGRPKLRWNVWSRRKKPPPGR